MSKFLVKNYMLSSGSRLRSVIIGNYLFFAETEVGVPLPVAAQ